MLWNFAGNALTCAWKAELLLAGAGTVVDAWLGLVAGLVALIATAQIAGRW